MRKDSVNHNNALHVLFGLIMIYIAIQHFNNKVINPFWYSMLLLLGFSTLGYHLYHLIDNVYFEEEHEH